MTKKIVYVDIKTKLAQGGRLALEAIFSGDSWMLCIPDSGESLFRLPANVQEINRNMGLLYSDDAIDVWAD